MINHIDIVRSKLEHTRKQIIEITGLTDEQLNSMMFEAGHEWLAHQGCDDHITLQFASTKEFWGFWRLDVWYPADRAFIRHILRYPHDPIDARYWYQCFHYVTNPPMNTELAAAGYHSLIKKLAIKP